MLVKVYCTVTPLSSVRGFVPFGLQKAVHAVPWSRAASSAAHTQYEVYVEEEVGASEDRGRENSLTMAQQKARMQ